MSLLYMYIGQILTLPLPSPHPQPHRSGGLPGGGPLRCGGLPLHPGADAAQIERAVSEV